MKLSLQQVSKRYGEQTALDGLDLQVDAARCLTLIGPSGGGKSTALRLIAGLESPNSGAVSLNDVKVPAEEGKLLQYRRSIGIVFQSYNLFPHLDALSNLSLPLIHAHRWEPDRARQRAKQLLERLGLKEHMGKRPAELSGGQNQRVAIARALTHNPKLILFDEPTSALDPQMAAEVLDVIEELIRDGKECIIVTHQMGFAKRVGDSAAFIAQGKVVECGKSPELFDDPQNPATRRFLECVLRY